MRPDSGLRRNDGMGWDVGCGVGLRLQDGDSGLRRNDGMGLGWQL